MFLFSLPNVEALFRVNFAQNSGQLQFNFWPVRSFLEASVS